MLNQVRILAPLLACKILRILLESTGWALISLIFTPDSVQDVF
jgi:hypothetical protein